MRETITQNDKSKIIDINRVYHEEPHEEKYLKRKYTFRYNEVLAKTEYKLINEPLSDYNEIDEMTLNSLFRELRNNKVKSSRENLATLIKSNFCEIYNPFHEYLNGLPEWDQKTDPISELADTIKTTDDEYWKKTMKKWLVALVGSLLDDNIINHQVIVFQGAQGEGKTRWTDKLVPSLLSKYYYSGTINTNNKDAAIHMAECMLINLDELENLQRRELGSLKEIITRKSIRLRRPYARFAETLPHRASFIGSVNQIEFLHDPTGSRRFLCHEVTSINADHKINMDHVYAQALYLFRDGFKYWFDGDEIKEILVKNENYEFKSLEEELLLREYKPSNSSNAERFLQPSQILRILEDQYEFKNRLSLPKLSQALNKHGFERLSKQNRYVRAVRSAEN